MFLDDEVWEPLPVKSPDGAENVVCRCDSTLSDNGEHLPFHQASDFMLHISFKVNFVLGFVEAPVVKCIFL